MKSIQGLYLTLVVTLFTTFASSQLNAQGQTIQQYQFVMGANGYE